MNEYNFLILSWILMDLMHTCNKGQLQSQNNKIGPSTSHTHHLHLLNLWAADKRPASHFTLGMCYRVVAPPPPAWTNPHHFLLCIVTFGIWMRPTTPNPIWRGFLAWRQVIWIAVSIVSLHRVSWWIKKWRRKLAPTKEGNSICACTTFLPVKAQAHYDKS